jgi:hypothetical protein
MAKKQLKKITIRLLPILINGFRSVLNPIFSISFSFIIVNYFSKNLWGNFVEYLLFFLIATVISGWGNKNYLLRVFSENPKEMTSNWQQLFLARLPICILFIIALYFLYPIHLFLYLILWLLGAFIHNSFLSIIYYNRDYIKSISIEAIGFIALITQLLILKNELDVTLLIRSYAISIGIKAMVSIMYYHTFLKFEKISFQLHMLLLSFPFFILGISGFLQSKVDVYAYSFFYEGKPLGEYQIISGFYIFAQSLVTLLSFPFVKNFYRLKGESIKHLKTLIIKYGILINLIMIGIIYATLWYGFKIKLSVLQICIGYFISFPSYVYTTHIYNLIRNKKESIVARICVFSFIINLLLSLFFLYLEFHVTGVMLANAISQLFCMFYALKYKIDE